MDSVFCCHIGLRQTKQHRYLHWHPFHVCLSPVLPSLTLSPVGRQKEWAREMFNVESRRVNNSSVNSFFATWFYLASKRESWKSNQGILALEPTFYPLVIDQFLLHLISKCKSSLCQTTSLAFSQAFKVFSTLVPIQFSELTSQYVFLPTWECHSNDCIPYVLKFHSSEMISLVYCCPTCKSLLALFKDLTQRRTTPQTLLHLALGCPLSFFWILKEL